MNTLKNLLIAFCLLSSLMACEQVIELDVPNRETGLVVDGLVVDDPGRTRVVLTNSSRVNDQAPTPRVSGAQVSIVEQEQNLTEILRETQPGSGTYVPTTANFRGRVGSSYRLVITLPNGSVYESEVEPLAPITPIDSIYSKPRTDAERTDKDTGAPLYDVFIDITDPLNEKNFYRFEYLINGTLGPDLSDRFGITLDELYNGQSLKGAISFRNSQTVKGAKAKVEMYSISKGAYNYYSLIGRQIFNGGPFATPPEPLRGNIYLRGNRNKTAFGYFAASAVTASSVVVGRE